MGTITPHALRANIQKGVFKPHLYLTNLCMAYFQDPAGFVSRRMFPMVPVSLSSSKFYEFDKGDLSRDNVGRKPEFGHVPPAVFGKREQYYHCEVDQVIAGIDQISALDFQRTNAPGMIDPRRAKVRYINNQINIHMDRVWAEKYFNAESWNHVYGGVGATPTAGSQFWQFDNDNCDPVSLFTRISNRMLLSGLREPNKLCLGVNAFAALKKACPFLFSAMQA